MALATQFKDNPSVELIEKAKKSDLLEIATEYGITVKTSSRKQEIFNIVVEYFIDEGILAEDAEELIKVPADSLQYQLEIRKLELEAEEKRLQREAEEKRQQAALEIEREKAEIEKRRIEAEEGNCRGNMN